MQVLVAATGLPEAWHKEEDRAVERAAALLTPRARLELAAELLLEAAFWAFDAARKAGGERLAFKDTVRALLTQASTPTETADDERLLWGVVHNAGRLQRTSSPRWVAVMEAVGCGSTKAKTLCERFGADPDERVGVAREDEQ